MAGGARNGRFRPGRSGVCEAMLFEFTPTGEHGSEGTAVRVAAVTIEEAIAYMRVRHAGFQFGRIEFVGMVRLISGSPVD